MLLAAAETPKTFTDTKGRQLEATIIEADANTVKIRRKDGREFAVPRTMFVENDQKMIDAWIAENASNETGGAWTWDWTKDGEHWIWSAEFAKMEAGKDARRFDLHYLSKPVAEGGIIGPQGAILNPADYDDIKPSWGFRDEDAMVVQKGRRWGVIHNSGKVVIEPQWKDARHPSEGMIAFQAGALDGERWGFADVTGKIVIPPKWKDALSFRGGLAAVRAEEEGNWAIIDRTGKLITDHLWGSFRGAGDAHPGLAVVKQNEKYGMVDRTGKQVIGCVWDHPFSFTESGVAWVVRDTMLGLVNVKGEVLHEPRWDCVLGRENYPRLPIWNNGAAVVVKGDEAWILRDSGKLIGKWEAAGAPTRHRFPNIPSPRTFPQTSGPDPLDQVLDAPPYPVKIDGKWGYVDGRGEIVIDPRWDRVTNFHGAIAIVYLEDRFGLIDGNGEALTPMFDRLAPLSPEGNDGTWVGFEGDSASLITKDFETVSLDWGTVHARDRGIYTFRKRAFDAEVGTDRKYGIMTHTGEVISPEQWTTVHYVRDGGLIVVARKMSYGALSMTGETILEPKWDSVQVLNDQGVIAATRNSRAHLYDRNGTSIASMTNATFLHLWHDGPKVLVAVQKQNKIGVIELKRPR